MVGAGCVFFFPRFPSFLFTRTALNILFVNYGDFTTNSLNHIGGFANTLCAAGHTCVVAVPEGRDTLVHIANPLFIAATFAELLARPNLFPNGQTADLIHAWTPREGVRKFTVAYQRAALKPARLLIHLEDNEHFLLEAVTGRPLDELRHTSPTELAGQLNDRLPDPLRHESFLRVADGITHIVDALRDFAPAGIPTHLLFPGIDFAPGQPPPADAAYRQELGLRPDEKILIFTGSNTFANEPEVRELYLATALLNQRGIPTRLVRTGFNSPRFLDGIADDVKRHVLDLGFIAKAKLPQLLALADVLVQPGHPGPFNDFRLPSKLPEFLASGKPVILPPTNIAAMMQDDREAVFLPTGSPQEIADTCERLFNDPGLCATLGTNGAAFARQHFDLAANTRGLLGFYEATLARPAATDWSLASDPTTTDATLFAARVAQTASTIVAAPEMRETLARESALLADLVRQLEQGVELAARDRVAKVEADCEARLAQSRLAQQHIGNLEGIIANLETQLTASRENVAGLEQARELTQTHADNLARETERLTGETDRLSRELATHQQLREQAEVLLRSARQQVAAFEDALARADAEMEALREGAANTRRELEAVVRNREEKIARMQASFSWRATSPLRALRRQFLDRPAPPAISGNLLGNIDYPQDWSNIPPTLNVRGWSLHRDRVPLRAVRARLGDKPAAVEFGIKRLDVLAHHRDHPGAERCGWQVKADIPRFGTHTLVIEAQDESGTWHIAHVREVRRTADASPPAPNSYASWVAAYDTLTPDSADRIRQKLAGLTRRPLISVLMPVYNTPEKWLVAAIESVRQQLYDNWELCIADDASQQPHVRKILARCQKKDPRIKVAFRETNGHISAASNSALALAHGEFIALLDHDDILRPHALACVALELEAHPKADLIYSDEDKIDEDGQRYAPYFKPDWNPDLFLVQNYISHLGIYRTLLVRDVGGFRVGYEGSQDWDLAMRVIERTGADRIRHIPKILYHWRSVPGSTAGFIDAKSYATQTKEKVICDHFARVGIEATVSPTKEGYSRIHYSLPHTPPKVALIIPTRNRLDVLRPCIESLRTKTSYPNFDLLIVDNDSDDPETLQYLRELEAGADGGQRAEDGGQRTEDGQRRTDNGEQTAEVGGQRSEDGGRRSEVGAQQSDAVAVDGGSVPLPAEPTETGRRVRVVRFPGEFNFSALINFGVSQTNAPLVGLLNNDLEVINPDWLTEMASHALRPEIGCVGAKLYYPDGRIQHVGVILGIGGVAGHAWHTFPGDTPGQLGRNFLQQEYSAVTAACLVIRREAFLEAGGFDERLKVAFNDVDFCLSVRAAGYRNFWTPYAELYHHESASRGAEDTLEKRDRFGKETEYIQAKWGDVLQNDPAYNQNLTLTLSDFSPSLPPRPWLPLES